MTWSFNRKVHQMDKKITLDFEKMTKNFHVFAPRGRLIAGSVYFAKELFANPENPAKVIEVSLKEIAG